MGQVIATESVIVHNETLNIDQQVFAGQPVPPDLVDAYREKVGDEQASKSPGADARKDAEGDDAPDTKAKSAKKKD